MNISAGFLNKVMQIFRVCYGVRVCLREKERDRYRYIYMYIYIYRERERERERERARDKEYMTEHEYEL